MRNNVNQKVYVFYKLQQTLITNYYALPLGTAEGSHVFSLKNRHTTCWSAFWNRWAGRVEKNLGIWMQHWRCVRLEMITSIISIVVLFNYFSGISSWWNVVWDLQIRKHEPFFPERAGPSPSAWLYYVICLISVLTLFF